ncbi:MAG: hypothetical protein P4N41_07370 [Negativicutes bacterium]|nr:hypothetical protein [Negativicutes bacterium]
MLNLDAINQTHPTVMMIPDFDYRILLQNFEAPTPNRTFRILEEYPSAAFVHKDTNRVIGYMRYELREGRFQVHYLYLTEKGKDYGKKIVRFLGALPGVRETNGFILSGDSLLLEKTGLVIDERAIS